MSEGVRRVVTGRRAAGQSFVASDDVVQPGNGAIELWQEGAAREGGAVPFYPPPRASLLRIVDLPAPSDSIDGAAEEALAAAVFGAMGAAQCRVDTRRDPWMHVTPTTDYVLVLSGVVDLLLDEGPPLRLYPGSVVVQLGTNHAWRPVGPDPARLLVVMTGTTENSVA